MFYSPSWGVPHLQDINLDSRVTPYGSSNSWRKEGGMFRSETPVPSAPVWKNTHTVYNFYLES
jgi:hypothetical protein